MNAYKLIASLHHQLAEAYDKLATEEEKPRGKFKPARRIPNLAGDRAVKEIRDSLRKRGIKVTT